MKIRIFYDGVRYRLRNSQKNLKFMEKVIRKEKRIPGDLSFVITSDDKLVLINREFLDHDYFTDVIAFNNNERNIINGEIYISIEAVKRNAINYKVSLKQELQRVMIHGTLHLCGYNDKTKKQKSEMRIVEDKWLEEVRK
ncbi:MAG: rRNA maturation RNase YbeY [Bacteroidia bacterium]|nr:rRNA maturation RNase YbeY [Bacteroidia bacterium]